MASNTKADNRFALSITIPTYNRVERLQLLLSSLDRELKSVDVSVQIIIVDNCSTDATGSVANLWCSSAMGRQYFRNQSNLGPIENVIRCFEYAEGDHCWIIGDDDILAEGCLEFVLNMLTSDQPDLVYLRGKGFRNEPPTNGDGVVDVRQAEPQRLNKENFCILANVHLTFITSIIVRKLTICGADELCNARLLSRTSLPQLSWVGSALQHGTRFVFVSKPVFYARTAASGGYDLYEVFSAQLSEALHEVLPKQLVNRMLTRVLLGYLPWIIMSHRRKRAGEFATTADQHLVMHQTFDNDPLYWAAIYPMLRAPLPIAMGAYAFIGVINHLVIAYDHFVARLVGLKHDR